MEANKKGLIEVVKLFLQPFFPKSKVITSLSSERLKANLGVVVDLGPLDEKIRKELKDNIEKILEGKLSDETSKFLTSLSGLVSHGLSDSDKCFPLFLTLLEHVLDKGLNLEIQKLLPEKTKEPLAAPVQREQTSLGLATNKIITIKQILLKVLKPDVAGRITKQLKKVTKESTFDIGQIWKDLITPYFLDTTLGEVAHLTSSKGQERIQFFTKQENVKKTLTALYGTLLKGDIDKTTGLTETGYQSIDNQAKLIAEFAKIVTEDSEAKQKVIELLSKDKNLETGLGLILDFVEVERTEKQKQLLEDLNLGENSNNLTVKDVIHKFLQNSDFQKYLPQLAIEPIKLLVDGLVTQQDKDEIGLSDVTKCKAKAGEITKTEQTETVKKAKDLKSKIKKACDDLQKIDNNSNTGKEIKSAIKEITELVTLDLLLSRKYNKDKLENEIKNFARFLNLSSFELEEQLELIPAQVNLNIKNRDKTISTDDLKRQITKYHQLVSQLIGGRITQLLPLLTQKDFSKCEAGKVVDIIGQTISDIYNINNSRTTGKVIYHVITGGGGGGGGIITNLMIGKFMSFMSGKIPQFYGEISRVTPKKIVERLFSGGLIKTVKATPKITKDQDNLKDKILTVVKIVIGRKPEIATDVWDDPSTQPRSQSCNDSEIKKDDNKSGELRRGQSLGGIPPLQRGVASTQIDITENPATVIRLTRKEFEIKPYIPMFALCALSSVMFTVNHFKNNLILFYASAAVSAIAFVTLIVKGTIDYRKSKNPTIDFVDSAISVGELTVVK